MSRLCWFRFYGVWYQDLLLEVGDEKDCFLAALTLFGVICRRLKGSQEVVKAMRRARQASMAARWGPESSQGLPWGTTRGSDGHLDENSGAGGSQRRPKWLQNGDQK